MPPTIQTIVTIAIFAIIFLSFLIHETARNQLDIYDLIMLSTVAIVPVIFVVFPGISFWFANIIGVEYPFVVMFGLLFVFIFVFVHRLIVKLHSIETDNRRIIQEISLLKQAIQEQIAKQNA
jgi:hypothetical protein